MDQSQIAEVRKKFATPSESKKPEPRSNSSVWRAALGKRHPRKPVEQQPTYVYFIRSESTGYVKIGHTHNLRKRLKAFQLGSGDKLYYVGTILFSDKSRAQEAEFKIHTKFDRYLLHGEWFSGEPDLITFIKTYHTDSEQLSQYLDS